MDTPVRTIRADGIDIPVRPVPWRLWRKLASADASDTAAQLDSMQEIVDTCASLPDSRRPSDVLSRRAVEAVFRAAVSDEEEDGADGSGPFQARP